MAEVAAVGWAISAPITTRLLNHGFDESEKLRDLEARILPRLALRQQQAERIPPERMAHLERWSGRLRSAFYDAEDIVDVADYHRLRKQVTHSGSKLMFDKLQHIVSGKTSKLKKSLEKLQNIIEEGFQYLPPLASTISNDNDIANPANKETGIVTTSSASSQFIIGRDEERDEIVNMLRETPDDDEPDSNDKCYSTIGIYGVAGSGKTTLAQHVCSYERAAKYFFPVIWIHVSQSFSVRKIYQEMLEAVSGEPSREFSNLDTLQIKIEAELSGRRFLLVLDNIWTCRNVNAQYKLDQLLSPLKVGKRGSKVRDLLVTSRFKDAAKSAGAQNPMKIPDLNEKDYFNLFMHYALGGMSTDDHKLETLKMIGADIVKNLKASPLAARLVGSQLRKQLNATFWRRVGDQSMLADTMGVLWWSYQQLDEHIRRCFAYCSMFPQGHMFERDNLVKLWMAEGFMNTTHSVEEMEIVGQIYFDELVSCSFIQAKQSTSSDENEQFSMHDLLHELAVMVAGKDWFCFEYGDQIKEFPPDVLHLFVRSYDPMKLTELICKLKKLRTLIFFYGSITIGALESMLKKLKKLRILDLTDGGALEFSHFENMSNLVSLWHIRNPGRHLNYSVISSFPGVGEMKSLRELSDFTVRKEKGYELQQLMIRSLLIEQASQIEPSLKLMPHPEEIDRFTDEQTDMVDAIVMDIFGKCDSVLQKCLRGSTSLTRLTLQGIPFIKSIPSEVMRSLSMLQYLFIISCAQFTHLQGLNHLSSMRRFEIRKCPNLTALQEDEKGRALHALYIDDIHIMPKLLSRECFISLQSLVFWEAEEPREEEILQQFSYLTYLIICFCNWNRLPENLVNLTCLQQLSLLYCKNIQSLPTLPSSRRVFMLSTCDQLFMKSCQTVGHQNYQKIAHVPWKDFFSYE
uniref:Uncharacterized protein n=1 Tax=Leersia perrieri TaxID=77586 RepID=A0A0D9WDG1_9ORYZ